MKPLPLSKKLILWGDVMKLEKAFQNLRETDHSDSFDRLDSWLDQNTKKKRPMKSIYKIAASFTLIAVIFIACSVPVEHNQEIGYMIKGVSSQMQQDLKGKISTSDITMSQINVNMQVYERDGEEPEIITEVMMILPEADYDLAEAKRAELDKVFQFSSVEILPIEEKVEKSLFASTLERFDIHISPELPKEEIEARIMEFLKEKGEDVNGEVEISVDELGRKVVEIKMEATRVDTLDATGLNGDKTFKIITGSKGDEATEDIHIEWTTEEEEQ